ncbi:DUF4870 domain-containing protein [Cellulosilyticum sp. I15G10I2]|uniref:DUF4870 domain-containing protein n=1 Tax=Cellulosilyticum sp. I15G10I2 TaxID=1892843 RepID=UPI00085C3B6A|nr:hypothetical protein [Cellulosilyticum sp. I15G10I2]
MSEQENKSNQTEVIQDIFEVEDIEKNKVIAGLAYFIFFLPLIVCPDSAFGKFHANQGLLLFIVSIAGNIIFTLIPFVGWIILPFFGIFIMVLVIMGLINGLQGKAKELPIIGKYRIIK